MVSIETLQLAHGEITDKILRAFFTVHTRLGFGFSEVLYQRALPIELAKSTLRVEREVAFVATYDDQPIGQYRADLLVERCVLVEIKSVERLVDAHRNQVLNYLRVSGMPVGLLLNFGNTAQVRRVLLDGGESTA